MRIYAKEAPTWLTRTWRNEGWEWIHVAVHWCSHYLSTYFLSFCFYLCEWVCLFSALVALRQLLGEKPGASGAPFAQTVEALRNCRNNLVAEKKRCDID